MKERITAFNLIFGILIMLPKKYKFKIFSVFIFMLMGGLLEFLSIGLMLPFLNVLTNVSKNLDNLSFNNSIFDIEIFSQMKIENLALFLIIVIFSSGFLRLYINWKTELISASIGNKLGSEAFKTLLFQKYEKYLLLDTHKQITTITIQISKCVSAINAFLLMISSIFICICISISLILIKPIFTISLATIFFIIYLIIVRYAHNKLKRNSQVISNESKHSLKYIKDSMTGFRDIKLNQSESFFLLNYRISDSKLRVHTAYSNFFAIFPRYAIEPIIIAGVIFSSIFLYSSSSSNIILPVLGVFVLGSQKLLPSIQQIYTAWARLKNSQSDLENVYSLISQKKLINKNQTISQNKQNIKRKEFIFSEIILENIRYRYPSSKNDVLKDLNLKIKAGEIIGIKGESGAGKTTLVDIIAGLLVPYSGKIFINGKKISKNKSKYQKIWSENISYIPQHIFLSDQPIANNVAFGIPNDLINIERVKKCLTMAQLSNFADNSTNNLKFKNIGDSGIRMSGGQRQRLAIARALYRNSKILIIDEGTSSLDSITEEEIIKLIKNLSEKITIIMIAHRLSTLTICNKIIEIQNGSIKNMS